MSGRVFAALLLCIALTGAAFGQINSAIGGTVSDATGALIPGVTITATNTQTSVSSTTVSNEAGAYNFPALIAGTYKVTAALPGFRTQAYEGAQLSAGAPLRLNFKLEVGQVSTSVDVVAGAETLSSSSASIGEVLSAARVTELPLVSNSVLDLIRILPGFRESPGGNAFDTFAGLPADSLNTVRDGISVTDGRFANGLFSTTTINPDLVGEVRLILTPVDAELGRGNGQVQITTRSGTNRYTGSALWNVQNSAMDPNTWLNNHSIDPVTGKTAQRNWTNNHEYSISYGGPIVKGKTFFFGLWEQQIHKERVLTDGGVLTDSAKLGIFRYFDGWNPQRYGVANTATPTTSTARVYTAVDALGNPVKPLVNANGTTYSGTGLMCYSVFGSRRLDANGAMVPFTAADCPGGTIISPTGGATSWDTNRAAFDTTGFIMKAVLKDMPKANYFGDVTSLLTPDGLNSATHRWVRSRGGNDDGNTTTGLGDHWARKQFNIKIDHNFSQNHKLSGSYTIERNFADSSQSAWPNGYGGDIVRYPHVLSTSVTSTLGPSLVNEARFGLRYNKTDGRGAFENDNRESLKEILDFFTGGSDGGVTRATGKYPVLVGASGAGNATSSYNFSSASAGLFTLASSHNGNRSVLYTAADTLSWTRGKHAFKFGGEFRPTTSRGYSNIPNLPTPRVYTGAGSTISPVASGGTASIGTALATVRNNSAALLYLLAGSVSQVEMVYWLDSYKDVQEGKWQSVLTKPDILRTIIINEGAGFFKDDWKITNRLTLNLGVRWEYYGSPYIKEGFTGAPHDAGNGVFGIGRSSTGSVWDNWLQTGATPIYLSGYGTGASAANALQCTTGVVQTNLPASNCNPANLTQIDFIGPNSPNPKTVAVPNDRNNFGPAIGFSYQVPWFPRTTLRGGYQMTFGSAGRNTSTIGGGTQQVIGSIPGATSNVTGAAALSSQFPNQYLDLTSIASIVPLKPTNPVLPGGTLPLYNRSATALYGYAPDFATSYAENFNLSATTNVHKNVTVDIRYVGTQGKKQQGDINVNTNNIYFNKELYDALDSARQGGNPALLTQMLAGINLGTGVIGTATNGAAALRASTVFNQNLINGNYLGVANSLLTGTSTTWTGFVSTTAISGVTPTGRLIRNGCDRIATSGQTTFNGVALRCFPENYLNPNPQLGTTNAYYRTNSGSTNYHSMQAQITIRPTYGMSVQSTYTWAKTLQLYGADTSNPLNRRADYSRPYSSVSHDLRTNGTIELPIGPNKLLLGNSSGVLARVLERWQASVILNLSGGRPTSIGALAGLNYAANGTTSVNVVPDVVGPFPVRKADLFWDGPANRGSLFGKDNPFVVVRDPQCNTATGFPTTLSCNLNAVARVVAAGTPGSMVLPDGRSGVIVLQNPKPGTQGSLGQTPFELPGVIRFDANLGKTFQITDTKAVQIRFDAVNVLNHPNPNPAAPVISINSEDFGYLTNAKTGNRTFQGQLRFTF